MCDMCADPYCTESEPGMVNPQAAGDEAERGGTAAVALVALGSSLAAEALFVGEPQLLSDQADATCLMTWQQYLNPAIKKPLLRFLPADADASSRECCDRVVAWLMRLMHCLDVAASVAGSCCLLYLQIAATEASTIFRR